MKYIFSFIILFLTPSINPQIRNIPNEDIKNIKSLFERLILDHDFAYTIFGSKPMSLADICLEVPNELPFYRKIRSSFYINQTKRSLKSWENFKKEFKSNNFIFLDKEKDFVNCLLFVLINKKNLFEVLVKHESTFKNELGDSFSPKGFIEKLELRETSLAQAIHKNQHLLGLMLGYGERNATLFQERFDLLKEIGKRKREHLPQDDELNRKLSSVEAQLSDFSEYEENPVLPPLYFLADISHPETIELKQRYENERKKIEEMMKKPGFMDKVMDRLVE